MLKEGLYKSDELTEIFIKKYKKINSSVTEKNLRRIISSGVILPKTMLYYCVIMDYINTKGKRAMVAKAVGKKYGVSGRTVQNAVYKHIHLAYF